MTASLIFLELQSHQQLGWRGEVSQVQLKEEGCTPGACSDNSWAAPRSCVVPSLMYKPGHMFMQDSAMQPLEEGLPQGGSGPRGCQRSLWLGLSQLVEQTGPHDKGFCFIRIHRHCCAWG